MNKTFKEKNDATLFKFKVGESQIVIKRVDNLFYLVQVGDKDKLIGDLMDTAEWLRKCGARWCIGHGKHSKSRKFILDRGNAVGALKDGWAVIALDMKTRLSYDEHYESVYNSKGEVVSNIPAGEYAIDFSQSQFKKTYNEVKAEQLFAKVQEEEKSEARKGVARKLFDKIEERNRREAAKNQLKRDKKEDSSATIPQQEQTENESFLKIAGAAAIFLGGLGLGLLIKN